jgi:hypothetical protein
MPTFDTLFPTLLGSGWTQLAPSVQHMHGPGASVLARGQADVSGAHNLPARCLRRLLHLPAPAIGQPVEVTIERHGSRETWTRHFGNRRMRSVLKPDVSAGQLSERLGALTLHFEPHRDGTAIDWILRGASVLGMPLPRALLGKVLARSESRDNRYAFEIDTQLPLLGQLVGYRGWLEIVDEH